MSLSSVPRAPHTKRGHGRGYRAVAALTMVLVACSNDEGAASSSSSTGAPGASVTGSTSNGIAQVSPITPPTTPASGPGTTSEPPKPTPSGSAPPSTSTKPGTPTPPSSVATNPTTPPIGTTTPTAPTTPTGPPPVTVPELPPPEAGSADAVAAQIDALYAPLPRYKASFLQKYTQKIQGTEKESKGVVFVERKNKISFRYDAPNLNRIVSDAVTLKVYVADDQQMFENPVGNTEYPGAMAFIMGEGIRKSFTFTFNEKVKYERGPVLVGKPRSPTPAYEKVQFYIDKDKLDKSDLGAVVSVLILDAQGNKNRFEFYDAQQPASIDASEFTFTPPAGTNITH